ncbi:ABCC1 [Symbiodinium natans]|uniref:ABCC1 protein n=1 Tax=Symbiodinium natans TaxID=878477 RepID=A0A812TC33_9DINO|nr:ABCC1 [Symbiodinium natans]
MPQPLERRFLRLARELGVCYITIARRPTQSLKDEHTRMLVVHGAHGEDTRGWKLFDLQAKREVAIRPRVRSSAEAFQRLDAFFEDFEAPHEHQLADVPNHPSTSSTSPRSRSPRRVSALETVTKRWRTRASRLWATLQLGLLTSGRRRTILQKVGLILLLLHTRTKLYWRFCRALAGSIRASLTRDVGGLVREVCLGFLMVLGGGVADQLLRYQVNLTTVELWSGAITHLQRKLLRELTLMRVSEEVSEPFQRLAEVRSLFEGLGAAGCDSLPSLAQLAFVAPVLVRSLKAWSLVLPVQLLLLRWLQHILEAGQQKAAERETHFQAQHCRLRERAEALALSCRSIAEQQHLEDEFEELAQQGLDVPILDLLKHIAYTCVADFRQMPSCVVRLLALLLFSVKFSNPCAQTGAASAEVMCAAFLFDRMMQAAFIAVQQIAKGCERAEQLDAQCSWDLAGSEHLYCVPTSQKDHEDPA